MGFIESLKAGTIRAADFLNRVNDPFDDFTRPAIRKESKKLHELELEFYSDLVTNFWGCDGQVLLHRIPLPQGSALDMGDQALWHGIYTGILALKWHISDRDGERIAAASVYSDLVNAVKGLQLHQTIHGEKLPRLIRGVSDDLQTWQDDPSNDTATGHLFGIYFAWKFGPETLRPVLSLLAAGLAVGILNHDNALVRADGTTTRYGALERGWKSDPLRITLALSIYAVAATITKLPIFMQAYSDLWKKYEAIVAYPKVKLWWIDNHNDTHRAAIHLAILADLTTGDPQSIYQKGIHRIRRMVEQEGNVWVQALCQFGDPTSIFGCGEKEQALKVLSEFTLRDKMFNEGRDNSESLPLSAYKWFRKILWNDEWQACQPIPRWMARSQDFFWQRNLRSLDVGSAGLSADSRLNGGDFLAAYWLSRYTGILTAQD